MGDDVLSQNEINDLLSDIGADTEEFDPQEAESAGDDEQLMVKIYDFLRPDVFTGQEAAYLESHMEAALGAFGSSLSGLTGTVVNITVTSLDPLTLDELMRSQPNPSPYLPIDFSIEEKGGVFFPGAISLVLTRLFMGLPADTHRQEVKLVEDETLREVFGCLIRRALTEPLSEHLYPCSLDKVRTDPRPVVLGDPLEMMLTLSLDMVLPEYEMKGLLTLALPAGFIRSLLWKTPAADTPAVEAEDVLVHAGLEFPVLLEESSVIDALHSGAELSMDPRAAGMMGYEKRRETK